MNSLAEPATLLKIIQNDKFYYENYSYVFFKDFV